MTKATTAARRYRVFTGFGFSEDNGSAPGIGLDVYGLNEGHDLLLLCRGGSFAESFYDLNGFGGRDAN